MLKSTGGWLENGNGNNNSGVAGLPGGARYPDGTFDYLGEGGLWWSSSEYTTGLAWYRNLYYDIDAVNRCDNDKSCGFSVRCLRD